MWLIAATAWVAVSCGVDQFAGLRRAVNNHVKNPGREMALQVQTEAQKLSGKKLKVTDDELVVTEPIILTFDHAYAGAAFFTFSGKARAKKDIVLKPDNDYIQREFLRGDPVGIRLVMNPRRGRDPYDLLAYAGTAPLQVEGDKIILKSDTEITIAGHLELGQYELLHIKRTGGRIWLVQSDFPNK